VDMGMDHRRGYRYLRRRMAIAPRALSFAWLLGAGAAATLVAREARAVDPFEIQVYDGTANAQGEAGLEMHLNTVASGLTEATPPEIPPNHQTHLTFEPSFGMTPWWELGGYFQTALRGDGHLDYAGSKLRLKFVTPPGWDAHVRLGANFELSILPTRYDPDRIGSEIRPIAAWENDDWHFAVNPILGVSIGGRSGPTFEPAVMALRKIGGVVSVGVEYYGDLGVITKPHALRDQEHYVYEVANLLSVDRLELNVGVGEGLTAGSNALVFKTIAGWTF